MPLREMVPWKRKELSRREEENPFLSLRHELDRIMDRFARGFGEKGLAERKEPVLKIVLPKSPEARKARKKISIH